MFWCAWSGSEIGEDVRVTVQENKLDAMEARLGVDDLRCTRSIEENVDANGRLRETTRGSKVIAKE